MGGYAEIIFETGSHSGVAYDDIEEVKGFLTEQHRRAVEGEQGGPTGHPAERVARVLLYPDEPPNLYDSDSIDAGAIKALIDGMTKDGKVDPNQLIQAIRDEVSPMFPIDQGRHASQWKTEETEEMDLSFLNNGGSEGGAESA